MIKIYTYDVRTYDDFINRDKLVRITRRNSGDDTIQVLVLTDKIHWVWENIPDGMGRPYIRLPFEGETK